VDNLVLIRVAAALDASLRGAVLRDLREEAPARFRLVFEAARGPRSVLISLRAERPWIGRPAARLRPPPGSMGTPFPALARRCLVGAVVRAVAKPGADRVLRMSFAEGHALVVELATHGANLLLLGADDRILALARRPRASAGRLAPEAVYRPPDLPARAFLPHGRDADGIDRYLLERARDGESQLEVLRRHVFGVGTEGARLVLAEARASGRSPGEVLADRLARLERGELDPVIDGPLDLLEVVRQGGFDPGQCRLLPWEPPLPEGHATPYLRTDDPAATAGLYHEAFEAWTLLGERRAALRAVLSRERERMAAAERKARGDLDSFQDPERYRRWGEALLAGLGRARRDGGIVLVPDPYDAGGAPLAVPAAPEKSLTQAPRPTASAPTDGRGAESTRRLGACGRWVRGG
jgi:predicted ribosome quality control (RQC) complex YloA/Tae2 family protein